MKVIDTPRTGKISNMVAYPSPFGQCFHAYFIPRDPRSPAQSRMRGIFGSASNGWGLKLTELQRQHWTVAAQTVPSQPSLGQYSHLSGQQLCVKINSTLRCVGQAPVEEPPQPLVFSPNPVGELSVVYDEGGSLRLLLVAGAAPEDIMLFGQAPCSAGRMKQRRVGYLGLLGPAVNGQCDITAQYVARFGQPGPGQKVFVVTCQHKNGWKGQAHVTNAIVPPQPLLGEAQMSQQPKVLDCGTPVPLSPSKPQMSREADAAPAAAPKTPQSQPARTEDSSSLPRAMYKGSTPDARGLHKLQPGEHPLRILGTPLVHAVRLALARLGAVRMAGIGA
jgi:hypothetical protein